MPIGLRKNVLYIRLKSPIKDVSVIKSLHPNIQDVRLPRQKRARFCLVKFANSEMCSKVKSAIKNKTYDGKKIVTNFGKTKKMLPLDQCSSIIADKIPADTKRRHIKKVIPSVSKIYIKRAKKERKNNYAILVFEKTLSMEELLKKKWIEINGQKVKLYKKKSSNENNKSKNISMRYFHSKSVINDDIDTDSDDSCMENLDVESVDLEYTGNFDSDSD